MDEELERSENEENTESEETARSVSSDLIRGHINTIILRALYEGDKYGYEIIADIESKSHGQYSLKQPSLYSALKRLEKVGCVASYWGGSVSGGRRKYFSLTDLGKEIAERNQSEWEYSRTIIDSLISDKDFDFNNPAPNSVDMRLLRDTTSRVPRDSGEEEEESMVRFGNLTQSAESEERKAELEKAEQALSERIALLQREQTWREEELARREEAIAREQEKLHEEIARGGKTEELERSLDDKNAETALLRQINETLRQELQEHLEESETLKLRIIEEERARSQDLIDEERRRCETDLESERTRISEEERRRADEYIAAEVERIKREQEEIYSAREHEIRMQNYRELLMAEHPATTPPVREEQQAEDEQPQPPVPPQPEPVVAQERPEPPVIDDALPPANKGGIDFNELEERARIDGIRIETTGQKTKPNILADQSVSLVHKGKCLFLSSIVACVFCIILGSILLGIRKSVAIPVFFPYVIWCIGIAVLLAMGLAYANHYGERAIRRNASIVLINSAVIYALCVIFTLIIALSAKIDFASTVAVASFIYVPVVFELVIPLFGVVYYFLVRSKKD